MALPSIVADADRKTKYDDGSMLCLPMFVKSWLFEYVAAAFGRGDHNMGLQTIFCKTD